MKARSRQAGTAVPFIHDVPWNKLAETPAWVRIPVKPITLTSSRPSPPHRQKPSTIHEIGVSPVSSDRLAPEYAIGEKSGLVNQTVRQR